MHRADARLKFVLTIAAIVAIGLLPQAPWVPLLLAWSSVIALALVARLGLTRLPRGSFVALPFLLAALPLVFTRTAEPLGSVTLGPLVVTASGEGLRMFATIALKSWVSVQIALLLTYTTRFPALLEALAQLRLPRIMVAIIGFMYRYLAVLGEEAGRMSRGRAARSAGLEGGRGVPLRFRAGVTGRMVGSLFLRSYERSERIHAAMTARGFTGEIRQLEARRLTGPELGLIATGIGAMAAFVLAAHRLALGS